MNFMEKYLATLNAKLPGLADDLAEIGQEELETDSTRGLSSFRARGGPGLLVPQRHGGPGATALEAVHCVRALGALAPSLSVATTMHNFSVAALVAVEENFDGFEWMILDAIANDRLLISSAFAEGLSGQGFLTPTMTAQKKGTGWIVNGSKKPCSLSKSMDLMSASVTLMDGDERVGIGVIVIPATVDGITTKPFWDAPVLRGAESEEVILTDVEVPDELVMKPEESATVSLEALEAKGLIWFTLLISAAYVGMASALVERLLQTRKGSAERRVTAASELEAATLALERVATVVDGTDTAPESLPQALIARYAAQSAIRRSVETAVECLGGMQYIKNPMVSYLTSAVHALAFHPPSRMSVVEELEKSFMGQQMSIT
ncbi:acyl-CoA dehydrogenase family protein [Saccharothrix deserti]|uniref:acyl-CoA dehydrogenase family protein n=1 Tax=Saccharothrix deserti TaxID=2593674 RepID=UPI00131EA73E|nr:acyl-CoA dehydrogenase family protein [Saccharothrix deserti]